MRLITDRRKRAPEKNVGEERARRLIMIVQTAYDLSTLTEGNGLVILHLNVNSLYARSLQHDHLLDESGRIRVSIKLNVLAVNNVFVCAAIIQSS